MIMSIKPGQKKEAPAPEKAPEPASSSTGIELESVARMFCPKCEQKINTSTVAALSEGKCPSCGEKIIVQGKVGPYRVLRLIGQGGMGAVYEGFDDGLGRKVAIKVTLVDVTRDRKMLETFQREAQVVAKLNHPNVVQVYTFGEEKGHPYLVMELLPGGSLMDRTTVPDPIDVGFLMGVAFEVAEGLNAAHEAGLLHGDIKPENILFDDKMHAKLVDFGLAAMNGAKSNGEVWGTPYYLAPEKVTDRKSNLKCDIYSLGATLYHVLAKKAPFEGVDGTAVIKAAIEEKAPPLSSLYPDLPPDVEAIINRMMEKDVSLRYPNYKSIIADIKKFLATIPAARVSRSSRMATHGFKHSTSTKKILLQSPVTGRVTGVINVPMKPAEVKPIDVKPAEPKPTGRVPKSGVVAIILAACVVIAGVGGYAVKTHLKGKSKQLVATMQKVEEQYSKGVTFIQDGYANAQKMGGEAQEMVSAIQKNRDKIQKANVAVVQHAEDIESIGTKMQALLREAEGVYKKTEQAKPGGVTQDSVDLAQLAQRQNELKALLEKSKAMKIMAEEMGILFVEMKNKFAVVEKECSGVQVNTPPPSGGKKELAKGSGRDSTSVDLGKQKGMQEFTLSAGESLVLAIWKSNPNEEGGGVITKMKLARKMGGAVEFKGEPLDTEIGTFSLKGLAKRDQFPEVARIMDALQGPKSGDFVLPSVQGLYFASTSDNGLNLVSSGRTNSDAEYGWAPAIIFTAKKSGAYSLSGTITLRAPKPQTTVNWMAWTTLLKQ
jgi:serine/threonine protein kinase